MVIEACHIAYTVYVKVQGVISRIMTSRNEHNKPSCELLNMNKSCMTNMLITLNTYARIRTCINSRAAKLHACMNCQQGPAKANLEFNAKVSQGKSNKLIPICSIQHLVRSYFSAAICFKLCPQAHKVAI